MLVLMMSHQHVLSAPQAPATPLAPRRAAQQGRDRGRCPQGFRRAGTGRFPGGCCPGQAGCRDRHGLTGTSSRRLDLVEQALHRAITDLLAAAEEAAAMDDAWEGFCSYLEKLCELQACDRAFNDLVSARLPVHALGRGMFERTEERVAQIFRNAQEQALPA